MSAGVGEQNLIAEFKASEKTGRPALVAATLAANRDSFRCILPVAATRTTDADAFLQGLRLALRDDPSNLPALRLLAWHQIRTTDWAAARETLRALVEHFPNLPDTRRELLRVGMLSPGPDADELLKVVTPELHNPVADASYRAQHMLANVHPIPNSLITKLGLYIDQAAAGIFRNSTTLHPAVSKTSSLVFLNIMERLIAADSIALIGNGVSLSGAGRGAEIDAHEVVIRCNFPRFSQFRADVGGKTDIVFFNESLVETLPNLLSLEAEYETCLSLAFHPEPAAMAAAEIYARNMNAKTSRISEDLRAFYRSFFYSRPTTGMMGIILISVILRKNLNIYGFDFYGQPTAHYYPSNSPVFLGHELHYEQWFLEKFLCWLAYGKISASPPRSSAPS